ncbi:hypothetical protein E2C01_004521 [Portunus trituberculatus]|uniref:Uncharacterized protein n=1 Tax=Portunus trituberculatus TaxID=210409 RepID=A0A5B7CPZ1_PORTR|nr:hypothetical protein [Portunus trituberculatus]
MVVFPHHCPRLLPACQPSLDPLSAAARIAPPCGAWTQLPPRQTGGVEQKIRESRPLPTTQDDLTAPTKSRIAKGDQGKVTSLTLPSRVILRPGYVQGGAREAAALEPSACRLFRPASEGNLIYLE